MDIGVEEIRRWHVKKNGWRDVGYHFVIRRNGEIEMGRPLENAGAHTIGQNQDSIGICLIGGRSEDDMPVDNFNEIQFESAKELVKVLKKRFGDIPIYGHRDFTHMKECPCFEVQELFGVRSQ